MSDIDLDDTPPTAKPRTRRARLASVLTAPAPAVLVLLVAALVVAAVRMPPMRPATPPVHEVQVGVSAYPAQATAFWRDAAGTSHTLDPWAAVPVRVPARAVVIAVAGDVDCTLVVDGVTVDTANGHGGVGVCSWVAT